jgi:hypothetical protein
VVAGQLWHAPGLSYRSVSLGAHSVQAQARQHGSHISNGRLVGIIIDVLSSHINRSTWFIDWVFCCCCCYRCCCCCCCCCCGCFRTSHSFNIPRSHRKLQNRQAQIEHFLQRRRMPRKMFVHRVGLQFSSHDWSIISFATWLRYDGTLNICDFHFDDYCLLFCLANVQVCYLLQ